MANAATPQVTDLGTEGAQADANFQVSQRIAWAFAPHEQASPDMTVRLEPGAVFDGTVLTELGAQNTGTITAPTTNPRIDRVVVDRMTGMVSTVTGTEAASPVAPAIPTGKVPVAQVLLQTSSSTITNGMITDERVLNALGLGELALLDIGQGLEDDGSGNLRVKLDGGTLARSAAGIKVAADGITAAEIAAGAVGTAEIADAAVTSAKIADDAVTSAKIAADAVGSAEIASGAVGTTEIADAAVTTAKLADDAVTSAKIAADAVGASEIADGSVGTAELADDAVTTAKIAAGAVGLTQLANQTADRAFGTNDTGQPVMLSAGSNITISGGEISATASGGTPGNGTVGQAQLKTTTGQVSITSSGNSTLPGGTYGFYPQVKVSSGAEIARIVLANNPTGTSYATSVGVFNHDSGTAFIQQRYIQASPPYDLGDGTIEGGFVFLLVEKATGTIRGTYIAADPPWANNGPTCIRPDVFRDGKPYRRGRNTTRHITDLKAGRITHAEFLDRVEAEKVTEVEITMAFKNADMALIPQPFGGFEASAFDVVLVDPMSRVSCALQRVLDDSDGAESAAEIIHRFGRVSAESRATNIKVPGVALARLDI